MLQQYKATRDYIVAANDVGLDAETLKNMRASQMEQLKAAFMRLSPTQSELTSVLVELKHDTPAFELTDRRALAAFAHQVFTKGPAGVPIGNNTEKFSQVRNYMHHYLPAWGWDKIESATSSDTDRYSVFISVGNDIGLRYPSETTIANNVSIIIAAAKLSVNAEQACQMKRAYSEQNSRQRTRLRGQPLTMREFPMSVADFIATHPDAYDEAHPPIANRISETVLREVRVSIMSV